MVARICSDPGVPPSFDEMKEALDLRSKSGIHRLITALEERGFAEARVITDWPDIVGLPLADHTLPERMSAAGVLHVRVGGGWAVELAHLEPFVLERRTSSISTSRRSSKRVSNRVRRGGPGRRGRPSA